MNLSLGSLGPTATFTPKLGVKVGNGSLAVCILNGLYTFNIRSNGGYNLFKCQIQWPIYFQVST